MSKIEFVENAILKLQADGKLPAHFEITSIRQDCDHYLFVYGKAVDNIIQTYYKWQEESERKKMFCTRYSHSIVGSAVWNEEEGRVECVPGLSSMLWDSLDVYFSERE